MVRISDVTDPRGITLCDNTGITGDGQAQPIADEFWTSMASNSSMVAYSPSNASAAAAMEQFTALGSRLNSTFAFTRLATRNASATFRFFGTRARWYSCVGPPYGQAAVYLDDQQVAQIDASLMSVPNIVPQPDVGFCDQMLFDTGPLPKGSHTLKVVVVGLSGNNSDTDQIAVAVEGFDYLKGISACPSPGPTPAPVSGAPRQAPQTPSVAPVSEMAASPSVILPILPTQPDSSSPPPSPPYTYVQRVLPPIKFRPSTSFVAIGGGG